MEHPSDLIHTVKPTGNELLEVELGQRGGHGHLNLYEAHVVEEAANVVDNLAAGDEQLAGVAVQDEVEVALAVLGSLVLQADMQGWELVQIGQKELHGLLERGQSSSCFFIRSLLALPLHGKCVSRVTLVSLVAPSHHAVRSPRSLQPGMPSVMAMSMLTAWRSSPQ
ncbi:hypothetical protein NMY22_g14219 [Coprinellus aureogranulatus]|nr:hypothetical protein NMY22_g14219 [Coprinellus aureogranulatus]